MTINLRLAHSADYPLALNLCEEMIRPLAVVWTDWIAADQEGHFADLWRQEHNRVITFIDQQNIGWVEFRRTGDETVLKQLYISPALQRHGVGSEVMRLLLEGAARDSEFDGTVRAEKQSCLSILLAAWLQCRSGDIDQVRDAPLDR